MQILWEENTLMMLGQLALKIKGVQFEYIEEDIGNKSPELLKYNPAVHKKIPIFVHYGKPIAESVVMLEYIDDTRPTPSILPKDPYQRAMVRFWAKFVDEKVLPTARMSATAKDKEELEKFIEEVRQQLKFLENGLTGKYFFGGKSTDYLDILVFYLIYSFQVSKEVIGVKITTEEMFSLLYKWIGKLLNMDVVLPPREKHVAHIRTHLEEPISIASK